MPDWTVYLRQHQVLLHFVSPEWFHGEGAPGNYMMWHVMLRMKPVLHQRWKVPDGRGSVEQSASCINEVILTKAMTEISDHIIDDTINNTVENVELCVQLFESFAILYLTSKKKAQSFLLG